MRRILLAAALALLVAAPAAAPAQAIGTFGPVVEVLRPGCSYEPFFASVDAAVGSDGITRGFASFGGACGDTIYYFQGHGDTWTSQPSLYNGRVLAVAWDATGTYLLYVDQHPASLGGDEVRITKRTSDGIFTGGRRLARPVFRNVLGDIEPTGDVVASGGSWWAVWTNTVSAERIDLFQAKTLGTDLSTRRVTGARSADLSPSLGLRPGNAATLAWQRTDYDSPSFDSDIWVATSGDDGAWRARRFEVASASVFNGAPDLTISGPGTYLAWESGSYIRFADNAAGSWKERTFRIAGFRPHVAVSQTKPFAGYSTLRTSPVRSFAAEREGTATWTGTYTSPLVSTTQTLVDATASGGKLTVLLLSGLRLYARTQV